MTTRFSSQYKLRPYQEVADYWLEQHPKSIYADDVGLGKSPTSCSVLARHLPALVVAPTYLLGQWFDLLCEALPHASINMPEGQRGRKEHELQQYADVRIINIEMLRTYNMPDVETLILDEAHHIRNPKSTQSEKAKRLIWCTPRAHLLTATPYYKADQDIWHLLHCIHPHEFPSYWNFIREWYTVNWYAPYAPKIYGINSKKRIAYNDMLQHYMLMRTYTSEGVDRQLPPLIEKTFTFQLPDLLRQVYTRLKRDWLLASEPVESVGSVYYTLRQLTMCADKMQIVLGILDAVPTESVLIYTWYKESAQTLAEKVRAKHTCTLLTGDIPPNVRAQILAEQKRMHSPRVIIATIEALQEGVNLEHIRHVVYAEETYVRGKHHQTLSRARRDRGDTPDPRPVIAYYIRAKRTVDETIPHIRNSRGSAGDHELARRLTEHD